MSLNLLRLGRLTCLRPRLIAPRWTSASLLSTISPLPSNARSYATATTIGFTPQSIHDFQWDCHGARKVVITDIGSTHNVAAALGGDNDAWLLLPEGTPILEALKPISKLANVAARALRSPPRLVGHAWGQLLLRYDVQNQDDVAALARLYVVAVKAVIEQGADVVVAVSTHAIADAVGAAFRGVVNVKVISLPLKGPRLRAALKTALREGSSTAPTTSTAHTLSSSPPPASSSSPAATTPLPLLRRSLYPDSNILFRKRKTLGHWVQACREKGCELTLVSQVRKEGGKIGQGLPRDVVKEVQAAPTFPLVPLVKLRVDGGSGIGADGTLSGQKVMMGSDARILCEAKHHALRSWDFGGGSGESAWSVAGFFTRDVVAALHARMAATADSPWTMLSMFYEVVAGIDPQEIASVEQAISVLDAAEATAILDAIAFHKVRNS